jgi:RNA polymerase subunit RPABC4/transcription elongation factor Spt4
MTCAKCHSPVDDGLNFCGECGSRVTTAKLKECRFCKSSIPAAARNCRYCGQDVTVLSQVASAAIVVIVVGALLYHWLG